MGFSPKTKTDSLVAAARHCCVCRKFKGIKIEVHHIIQEADGGSNDFENAIPLCLDCHVDAGHYNPRHPKGTKFSKEELRKQRDAWYQIVKEHKIQPPADTSPALHFRHLVVKDYETAEEIYAGDLKEFPYKNSMLYKNHVFDFVSKLFHNNKQRYHVWSVQSRTFKTTEEIFETYPETKLINKSETEYPYFHANRNPKKEDLLRVKDQLDSFVLHLMEMDIDPTLYSEVVYESNFCGCGDDTLGPDPYLESVIFKPLWFSFVSITNIAKVNVELEDLIGQGHKDEFHFTNVRNHVDEVQVKLNFPKVRILPDETIIIPTSLLLAPFNEEIFDEIMLQEQWLQLVHGRSQVLKHLIRENSKTEFCFIGKYLRPNEIRYISDDRIEHSEIHTLDLNNLFMIDRMWHMGSCPHLFFEESNGTTSYARELFTKYPGESMQETILVPANVNSLIIAELEDEETFIETVTINEQHKLSNIKLSKGESYRIEVLPFDTVSLQGYYISQKENIPAGHKTVLRNSIISKYLRTVKG